MLNYLDGGGERLDPAMVGRDDQCALGCWIHGDGRALLRGNANCAELKGEHAGFHRCAAEVIRAQLAGNTEGAREQIAGEFNHRSARVIGLLEKLRGAGKNALPRQLTASVPRNVSSVKMPALPTPDDDEWQEF